MRESEFTTETQSHGEEKIENTEDGEITENCFSPLRRGDAEEKSAKSKPESAEEAESAERTAGAV
jgi:hypothetical protein